MILHPRLARFQSAAFDWAKMRNLQKPATTRPDDERSAPESPASPLATTSTTTPAYPHKKPTRYRANASELAGLNHEERQAVRETQAAWHNWVEAIYEIRCHRGGFEAISPHASETDKCLRAHFLACEQEAWDAYLSAAIEMAELENGSLEDLAHVLNPWRTGQPD
jgi:hypothetical protein